MTILYGATGSKSMSEYFQSTKLIHYRRSWRLWTVESASKRKYFNDMTSWLAG